LRHAATFSAAICASVRFSCKREPIAGAFFAD